MVKKEILSAAGIKGGSQPKHRWTDEERAIVQRDYRGTNASAAEIAHHLGVTKFAVKGQAAALGILQQKSPPWSPSEIEQLKELIHRHPVGEIAKKLHRSHNTVKVKATRLKLNLRSRDGWYTKKEVSEICGVDHKKVQQWIDAGALKATWHYGRKPCKEGMSSWHIEAKDLRILIIKHCGELLARNVDLQQIVWLLVEGELQNE
jgi:DNA-binding CsgD family transcriptional regulator